MWFYDDKGFMTACDPFNKPQSKPSCKSILGMGFHLVDVAEEVGNIVVNDNGCVKTTTKIKVDTQLVM